MKRFIKKSLQHQLTFMLISVILLVSLVAAGTSFSAAYIEAKELQDDMLRQIAYLAASNSATNINTFKSKDEVQLDDIVSRFTVIHLPQDKRPNWLTNDVVAGFHTLDAGLETLRVFVRDDKLGRFTIVAQPTDSRNEIAMNGAISTLIPLLVSIPVLAWLITFIVRRELAPIAQLSARLDTQQADNLEPLNEQKIPEEITPFVFAINRLLKRINQLLNEQRRFIADAAHEMRSPLTALSLQTQNIENAKTLGLMRKRIPPLREGIERARRLSEQLLNLAKSQITTFNLSSLNVSNLVRALFAEYQPQAKNLSIEFALMNESDVIVYGEPEALSLILRNALENAFRFTPKHGLVTLQVYTLAKDCVIEVADSGPGIPVDEREKVFEPFYFIPHSEKSGSGLGLAIARDAALKLGGEISLRNSCNGSGLIFCFRLALIKQVT